MFRRTATAFCRAAMQPATAQGVGSIFDFDFYDDTILKYSGERPRPLPLSDMICWYGEEGGIKESHVLQSARYLHRELLVRLAKTLTTFERQPLLVLTCPGIVIAFREYQDSFKTLVQLPPPETFEHAMHLTEVVNGLAAKSARLLNSMSEGLRHARGVMTGSELNRIDEFVHLFIGHRLSRRTLAANHTAIVDHYKFSQEEGRAPKNEIGVFHSDCLVSAVVDAAGEETQEMCDAEFGQFPELKISDPTEARLFCVPANLQAILVETLKNSMKATVERHGDSIVLPAVHCKISRSPTGTVFIQLSDQGGGLLQEQESSLWRYGVSGATLLDKLGRKKEQEKYESQFGIRNMDMNRLSGYGFGLPLSKARANYFGGELWIRNLEGYGVDTFVSMPPATSRWR